MMTLIINQEYDPTHILTFGLGGPTLNHIERCESVSKAPGLSRWPREDAFVDALSAAVAPIQHPIETRTV
jgi:hypothetical protein